MGISAAPFSATKIASSRLRTRISRRGPVTRDDSTAFGSAPADLDAAQVEGAGRRLGEGAGPGERVVTAHLGDDRVDPRPGPEGDAHAALDVIDPDHRAQERTGRAIGRREVSAFSFLGVLQGLGRLLVLPRVAPVPVRLYEVPLVRVVDGAPYVPSVIPVGGPRAGRPRRAGRGRLASCRLRSRAAASLCWAAPSRRASPTRPRPRTRRRRQA